LNSDETAALAQQVAGQRLSAKEIDVLHVDTEGNPLFIVETIHYLLSKRYARSDHVKSAVASTTENQTLPPKVQAVIEQRLAQLSPVARDLAIFAAMLGREFSIAELTAATEYSQEAIVSGIDELWQRRIIRERDGDWYDFSHEKLRDVTLFSVSRARRRLYHLKVARALEQTYAAHSTPVSGRLAAHYEAAGQPEHAFHYYEQAAEGARLVYASAKAIQLLRRALDILGTLPEDDERDRRELQILTALGSCLVVSEGYGSQEVWHTYERAYALCEKLGQPIAPPILRALAIAYVLRGDFSRTYHLGEELLSIAEKNNENVLIVEGYYVLGVTNFWMGRLEEARESLGRAIEHYNQQQHAIHTDLYAQDPKVICMCRLARTLWYLGYIDQALEKMKDCLALALILDHPYSRSYALAHAGFFFIDMRDWPAAEDVISALRDLTAQHEFALFKCLGNALYGTFLAQSDRGKAGLDLIGAGLEAVQELDAKLFLPQLLGYAANTCLIAGRFSEGLAYLSQAFGLLKGTNEHYFVAELYRLRGELELAQSAKIELVIQQFTRALAVAQKQGAKSLELRAASSLCRFQISLGNSGAATSTLQSVYTTFSEGFSTPDLRDASTLLSNVS
jgi:predicted ATPase